jgi:hypothetical protein
MTFKEFIQIDELQGQYGNVQAVQGPLGIHSALKQLHTPVKKKGTTTVSRAMSAGKFRSPSRPAILSAPNSPTMIQSNF